MAETFGEAFANSFATTADAIGRIRDRRRKEAEENRLEASRQEGYSILRQLADQTRASTGDVGAGSVPALSSTPDTADPAKAAAAAAAPAAGAPAGAAPAPAPARSVLPTPASAGAAPQASPAAAAPAPALPPAAGALPTSGAASPVAPPAAGTPPAPGATALPPGGGSKQPFEQSFANLQRLKLQIAMLRDPDQRKAAGDALTDMTSRAVMMHGAAANAALNRGDVQGALDGLNRAYGLITGAPNAGFTATVDANGRSVILDPGGNPVDPTTIAGWIKEVGDPAGGMQWVAEQITAANKTKFDQSAKLRELGQQDTQLAETHRSNVAREATDATRIAAENWRAVLGAKSQILAARIGADATLGAANANGDSKEALRQAELSEKAAKVAGSAPVPGTTDMTSPFARDVQAASTHILRQAWGQGQNVDAAAANRAASVLVASIERDNLPSDVLDALDAEFNGGKGGPLPQPQMWKLANGDSAFSIGELRYNPDGSPAIDPTTGQQKQILYPLTPQIAAAIGKVHKARLDEAQRAAQEQQEGRPTPMPRWRTQPPSDGSTHSGPPPKRRVPVGASPPAAPPVRAPNTPGMAIPLGNPWGQ